MPRILPRLGVSPQRSFFRAHQQDPKRVGAWCDTESLKIRTHAKRDEALIVFADDESWVHSAYHRRPTWGQVGRAPVVSIGARYRFNMLSAADLQGNFRFMTVEVRVDFGVFRELLKRLIAGMER